MTTKQILKQLDWNSIFGNTSQYENLYEFLDGFITLDDFYRGFYPRSKNKSLIKKLTKARVPYFKKICKKMWNVSHVQQFHDGSEGENRQKYLDRL